MLIIQRISQEKVGKLIRTKSVFAVIISITVLHFIKTTKVSY